MYRTWLSVVSVTLFSALAFSGEATAQGSAPNLSGSYRCTPEPSKCLSATYSISQTGTALELKSQDGLIADAKLTSNRTVSAGPPFNSNGLILQDNSIQWSNGTLWHKQ
jgi:hypothetical protein